MKNASQKVKTNESLVACAIPNLPLNDNFALVLQLCTHVT